MAMNSDLQQLTAENTNLRARLEEADDSIRAILGGEADGLLVPGADGAQLFALKNADRPYRALIESMSEGAVTLSREGLILYANGRFAQMLATPLERVIGSEISAWFMPESRHILQTLLKESAAVNRREELFLAAADGARVPVYVSLSHLLLEEMPACFCMVATDLTAQKRNEAILAAEEFVRAILEQAADAIVICDGAGRIIRASKQTQALCGMDCIGRSFEEAFPLRQPNGAGFSSVADIDTTHHPHMEARLERAGRQFDLLVSVGHLTKARSEMLGSVVTLTDITEHKQAEQALRKSDLRYRSLFDNMLEGYAYCRGEFEHNQLRDFVYLETNGAFETLTGLKDVVGKKVTEVLPGFVRANHELAELFARVALSGNAEKQESYIDALGIWVSVAVYSPQREYFIAVFDNITPRKLAEQALSQSEEEFRTLAESMPQIVWITRADGWNIYFNQQWMDYTGLTAEESLGHGWNKPFHPHDQKRASEAWNNAADTGSIYSIEARLRRLDGAYRWWLVRGVPLKDAAGGIVKWLGTCTDIDDMKVAQLSVIEANRTLRENDMSLRRLNRVYAILSAINTLIVRARDRDDLFSQACQIAVGQGQFTMAWIGVVDRRAGSTSLVASAGVREDWLTAIKERFSHSLTEELPSGSTLSARAIREKKAVVVNDLRNSLEVSFISNYADCGIRSIAMLPLVVSNEAIGVIALYASELEFFQEEELKVLNELAGNIAFAIDHIAQRDRLSYIAYYDDLTGLANRSLFMERVAQYLRSMVGGGSGLAVGVLDLERFKNINHSLGHAAGDELLKQVADWLARHFGDANLLARVDADHFAFVLLDIKQECDVPRLIEHALEDLSKHGFMLDGAVIRVAAKVGVAIFPDDGSNCDILFRNADIALKKAKGSGERYTLFALKMNDTVLLKPILESQLREALDNEEFVLHYQPKVSLASGKLTGAEALIRWNHPRRGLVPPGEFIPLLEETGLIFEVGRWALHKAVKEYLRWRAAGLPAVRIAVNVSPLQVRSAGFVAEVTRAVEVGALAAAGLELEITETTDIADFERTISALHAIRQLGVAIAIDDFGTGFSSLNYLAKLPIDSLKIDRSFVDELKSGARGMALVSGIVNLGHALGLRVVAEGVETEQQSRLLREARCDEGQGYLYGKPVPVDVFEATHLVGSGLGAVFRVCPSAKMT